MIPLQAEIPLQAVIRRLGTAARARRPGAD